MKILVVDDSSTMRRIVMNALKSIGYTDFAEAGDGKQALAKLEEEGDIDFIVTDWNMPVITGLEFVQKIKQGPYKNLPILMVTTNAAKEDVIVALKAGVNHYVVKPFTPNVLKEKIEAILAKHPS